MTVSFESTFQAATWNVLCVDNDTAVGVISRMSMVWLRNELEGRKRTQTLTQSTHTNLAVTQSDTNTRELYSMGRSLARPSRFIFFFSPRVQIFVIEPEQSTIAQPRQLIWLTSDKRWEKTRDDETQIKINESNVFCDILNIGIITREHTHKIVYFDWVCHWMITLTVRPKNRLRTFMEFVSWKILFESIFFQVKMHLHRKKILFMTSMIYCWWKMDFYSI